ncbi:MAG: cytochrome P450 [Flavobacteriaceae bacterium]
MSDSSQIKRIKDLPKPKGHFIFGHLPQFNVANKHQVLERWVDECGDLFRINFVGKQFVVSANPNLNAEILKLRPDSFRRFSKIDEILSEMGIIGVFNAEGNTWKRHRKPTSEALNLRKVKGYYPIISSKTQKLLTKWSEFAKNNTTVNVQKELIRYTIDITTAVAFGYQLDTINHKEDDFQKHLELIFPMVNERITAPIALWRIYKQQKDKALDNSLKAIEQLIHEFIKKAKTRLNTNPELKQHPSNFLEALLVEQEENHQFSDQEIYGNVFSILLAGEDTTSNSIAWAIYYLAQNPEIVAKVREEAYLIYDTLDVPENTKQLSQLKYANAVAQETIRLKPVTPNLYMQANEDVTLQGLYIPKDTTIMLQNKVAQTKEHYFSNATEFIPERWIKNGCPAHQNHSPDIIKAFGGGARFCPGMNLAMHEMTIAISTICKQFDFKLAVDKHSVKEHFAFTMYPDNLLIHFKKRQ